VDLAEASTLLRGPNEAGKSTLVEAAHRALFLRYKTSGKILEEMKSLTAPGYPQVEVTFDAREKRYTVSKVFRGAAGSALLTEQDGRTWRDDDAEAELMRLLSVPQVAPAHSISQWGHLWVWQGESSGDPTEHANARRDELLSRLRTEGGMAAMQSALDAAIAEELRTEHAATIGARGVIAGSPLGKAEARYREALNAQREAHAQLERLLHAVEDERAAAKESKNCEEGIQRLTLELQSVLSRLARVDNLRGELRVQEETLRRSTGDCEASQKAHDAITTAREKIDRLREALGPREEESSRLADRVTAGEDECLQASARNQAAADILRANRECLDLALAWVTLFERRSDRDAVESRSSQIEELRRKVGELERQLEQLPAITPEALDGLRHRQEAWRMADATLQAMGATVEVLETGDPVVVAGQSLAVGESRVITEDAEIQVGTTVRLRVAPGGGISLQQARGEVERSRRLLMESLAALGVESIESATEASRERQRLLSEIEVNRGQLRGAGAATIDADRATARERLGQAEAEVRKRQSAAPAFADPETIEEAKERRERLQETVGTADVESQRCQAALQAAERQLNGARAEYSRHQADLQRERDELADSEANARALVDLHGEDGDRIARLASARRDVEAASDAVVATLEEIGDLQPEYLEKDEARLGRAISSLEEQKTAARERAATARGMLSNNGSTDPQYAVAMADAKEDQALEALESEKRRKEAIELLNQLFAEERKALATVVSQPFAEKITGYLQCIFGTQVNTRLRWNDDKFGGLEIIRPDYGDAALSFEKLSTGTKEQIAAAMRLAMAEVLAADHDGSLPIVFDDAFTNSDSDRVEKLQRMLDLAAGRGLQVIVLSCDQSSYDALGARTIDLKRPEVGALRRDVAMRDSTAGESAEPGPPSMELEELEEEGLAVEVTEAHREQLLAAVRDQGGSAGNERLRQALGWEAALYDAVKMELVNAGQLVRGRGRSGSVRIPE
jgi:DNA repair exonuclease SbcCD ATPase subunit